MNIAKTKIFVLVAVVLLSALLAISFAFGSSALTSSAEAYITNSFSSDISVTVYDGEGNIQTTTSTPITLTTPSGTEISNYTSYSFPWSNIDSFVVNLDTTSIPDATSYTYSYSVTWAPARIQDGRVSFSTDHTHQLELFTETVSSKDEIDTSFRFYVQVDDEQTLESGAFAGKDVFGETFTEYGGWGLYMFSFTYQDTMQSAIFELRPDDVYTINRAPELSYEIQPSSTGLRNAYLFTVDDGFKYVNGYQINWFVDGTSADGRSFVLLPSDIENPNTQNALYGADSQNLRTGHTFLFDPPMEGTWTIRCEILSPDYQTTEFVATSQQLSTVDGFDPMTIVWIVIAAAAVMAIIVGVVIYVSIKKEKVY